MLLFTGLMFHVSGFIETSIMNPETCIQSRGLFPIRSHWMDTFMIRFGLAGCPRVYGRAVPGYFVSAGNPLGFVETFIPTDCPDTRASPL